MKKALKNTAVKIAPSIIAANYARLGEEVAAVTAAGADYIHLDVMDGHFVPNITFGADLVRHLRPVSTATFDVHLMIKPVDPFLKAFADAGADIITVHVEAGAHLHRTLSVIRDLGKKVGVALNPATPIEAILPVLPDVDLVCVMTVNPGFGGQTFIPSQLHKITELRQAIATLGKNIEIEIDGGVNLKTAAAAIAAGGTVLVAGTAVFGEPAARYASTIAALRQA